MKIVVNGEARDVPSEIDLKALMEYLAMPDERIAVELNLDVVPKTRWEGTAVKENDRVEIIHFVGGG